MISFSDVKKYINDSPAVVRFKPWWEISLDLLLAGLFLIMILAWTRSYTVEAGGIICVPLEGDVFSFATSEVRYIQSRCYMESHIATLEFYPYILLVQWCLMFLCQISWIWIPSVNAKFVYFHNIFSDIIAVEPSFVFDQTDYRMLPEIDYSDENREKLRIINDKITFVLMDKNYLSILYRRKTYIFTILIFCCLIIMSLWLFFVKFLQANFPCSLPEGPSKKQEPDAVCSVSPHLFIYGIMVLHVFILFLMLLLSCKSALWHFIMKRRIYDCSDRLFGEFGDNYRGLPGYEDLSTILELVATNVHDGQFMIKTILYVLTLKYDRRPPVVIKDNQAISVVKKRMVTYSFFEEFCIVSLMADEIGLSLSHCDQQPDFLFDYFDKFCKSCLNINFSIQASIKNLICSELLQNYSHYSSFGESEQSIQPRTNNDLPPPPYSVFKKAHLLLNGNEWPDHLLLMAVANILKIKIVLITVHTPCHEDVFSHDIFKPMNQGSVKTTLILAFISPHYYYSVDELKYPLNQAQISNKNDFIKHSKYRDRLRQNTIRRVGVVGLTRNEQAKGRKQKFEIVVNYEPTVDQNTCIDATYQSTTSSVHTSVNFSSQQRPTHLRIRTGSAASIVVHPALIEPPPCQETADKDSAVKIVK